MCSTRNCLCGITPEVKMLMLLLGFTLRDANGAVYVKLLNRGHIHLYYRADADKVYVNTKLDIKSFATYEDKNIAHYLTKLLEN